MKDKALVVRDMVATARGILRDALTVSDSAGTLCGTERRAVEEARSALGIVEARLDEWADDYAAVMARAIAKQRGKEGDGKDEER